MKIFLWAHPRCSFCFTPFAKIAARSCAPLLLLAPIFGRWRGASAGKIGAAG